MRGHDITDRIKRDSRVIRVMHLHLDASRWNRGMDLWEAEVAEVDSVIRTSTGLKRVFRTHGRNFVDFRVRKELFDQAAIAVRFEFGEESNIPLRQ